MKKNIIIAIVLTLFLVGCGTNKEFTMNEGIETIEKNLSNMKEIQDSTLTDAYNLDLNNMDEHIFKQNSEGDFYAIIKPNDKSTVKSDMEKYFVRVKDFNSSYSPERLEILENRVEKELNGYLIYIIAKDADNIYSDIIDSLN